MKERPILFSAPMVRAILEDHKSQTRRVMKEQPSGKMTDVVQYLDNTTWCFTGPQRDEQGNPLPLDQWTGGWPDCGPGFTSRYGQPGDRLWLRETWQTGKELDPFNATEIAAKCIDAGFSKPGAPLKFLADGRTLQWGDNDKGDFGEWGRVRSSRFMPRWASRITLEITDVRVQRVQEISEGDIIAEGCPNEYLLGRNWFTPLWDSINAKRGFGWDVNPWVWAVSFKAVTCG